MFRSLFAPHALRACRMLGVIAAAWCGTTIELRAQPNVLFISIDDLNDWVQPYGGHPDAQTPNILALANDGIVFSKAYCPSTECNSSRTALMKGVSPARSGVHCNTDPMEGNPVLDFVSTLPEWFSDSRGPANGYYTISRGKIFHTPAMGAAYFEEWHTDGSGGPTEPAGTFPHNGYPQSYLSVNSPAGRAIDWAPTTGVPEHTTDYQAALWAKNLLEGNHATNFDNKPFFMAVGISKPHIPLYAPQQYFDLYDPATVALPITEPGRPPSPMDLADIVQPTGFPKYSVADDFQWATDYTAQPIGNSTNPADNCWGEFVAAYLACASYADACVGEILAGLNNGPYRDNTIVVLWSDHGWFLGEKSQVHKRKLWETSARVPLIIKLPNDDPLRQVGQCDRVVNLLDLYPTLTDYCGLPSGINPDNDGRSLVPLLRDPTASWPYPTLVSTGYAGRADHSIRDERWNYIRCYDGTEELYDRATDPNEYSNLANLGVPAYDNQKTRLRQFMPDLQGGHRAWRLPYGGNARGTLGHWRMNETEVGTGSGQLQLIVSTPGLGPLIVGGGNSGTALRSFGAAGRNRAEVVGSKSLFPSAAIPELTVEAWVKFDPGAFNLAPGRTQLIVHKMVGARSGTGGFSLALEDWFTQQALAWEVADGTHNIRAQVNATGRLQEGRWHHIAGTWGWDSRYNDYRAKLYLDGWEVASNPAPGTQVIVNEPKAKVSIGNHGFLTGLSVHGLIDEVRISDVAYAFAPLPDGALIWAQDPIAKPGVAPGVAFAQSLVTGVDVIDLNGDPITFSKVSFDSGPAHPAGDWLTVGMGGSLQGTPATEGRYRWTLRAHAGGETADAVLEVTVGNSPLTLASCTFRNGGGGNPAGYSCLTPPVLGADWRGRIAFTPDTVGLLLGVGLGGPHPGAPVLGGELLIEPTPTPVFLPVLGTFSLAVPGTSFAAGFTFSTQGIRIDDVGGLLTPVLLNAQDLVLGY